jgi:hypothetical protein
MFVEGCHLGGSSSDGEAVTAPIWHFFLLLLCCYVVVLLLLLLLVVGRGWLLLFAMRI